MLPNLIGYGTFVSEMFWQKPNQMKTYSGTIFSNSDRAHKALIHKKSNKKFSLMKFLRSSSGTAFAVSAAFDSVDHDILLRNLSTPLGLSGNFLDWLGCF